MSGPLVLLKNTPEDLWAVSVKDLAAQELLLDLVPTNQPSQLPTFRVLIAYSDQLYDFVQTVPPLAWELLEYATEPLEIIYSQKKKRVKDWGTSAEICVRWAKQPKLSQFLRKYGPHWAVPDSLATAMNRPKTFLTKECYDKNYPYQMVKTIAIAQDDSFSFIR